MDIKVLPVKRERIIFIDLMRALAVLMMVEGHTVDSLLADSYRSFDSNIYNFWNFVRGLTAPIFLFSAGTVFTYLFHLNKLPFNENPRVKKGVKRFFLLIFIGYIMRWPTPYLFYFGDVPAYRWQVFFSVDVLHLIAFGLLLVIGLSYLSEKMKIKPSYFYSIAALLIFAMYPILFNVDWKQIVPIPIAAYLYQGTGSLFPLIPWVGYVFCGALIGNYLAAHPGISKNKKFSLNLLLIGVALIIGSVIGSRLEVLIYKESHFWTTSPNLIFFRLGIVILLNSFLSYLSIQIKNIPPLLVQIGRNSLSVYIVHIIILYGSPWSIGLYNLLARSLDVWTTIGIAILMISSMVAMVQSFQIVKGYYRKRKLATEQIRS